MQRNGEPEFLKYVMNVGKFARIKDLFTAIILQYIAHLDFNVINVILLLNKLAI